MHMTAEERAHLERSLEQRKQPRDSDMDYGERFNEMD